MASKSFWALGVVTCAFLLWTDARAQSSGTWIELGEVRLTVGLPKESVMAKLARQDEIHPLGENYYLVTAKDEPHRTIGTVEFKNGRLASISRYWGPRDERKGNGVDLALSLYRLARAFVQDGKTGCTIGAGENGDPRGDVRSLEIKCGDKSINVDIIRLEDHGEIATVEERLAE